MEDGPLSDDSFPAETLVPELEEEPLSPILNDALNRIAEFEPVLRQRDGAPPTVTSAGVSPFELLTPNSLTAMQINLAMSSIGDGYQQISPEKPQEASIEPNQATEAAPAPAQRAKRRRTQEKYHLYGVKNKVDEALFEGDLFAGGQPAERLPLRMNRLTTLSGGEFSRCTIAAYRVRDEVLAERIYPCSHEKALAEPENDRWKNRRKDHVHRFLHSNDAAALLQGDPVRLVGLLECAAPCWSCSERLQRFAVLLDDTRMIAYTGIIGVQVSRARQGRANNSNKKK